MSIWEKDELELFGKLNTPIKIQQFLDSIPYNSEEITKSPRYVIKEKSAHCTEGAFFSAVALEHLGYKPLVVDLMAVNDDDHFIAVFKEDGYWGAIAKSNFTTLRFREPLYKSIRELAMSYFDFYFNTIGEKTLREYSKVFDLTKFDKNNWRTTDKDIGELGDRIDKVKHYRLLSIEKEQKLSKVSNALLEAGLIGSNPDGLFKPNVK